MRIDPIAFEEILPFWRDRLWPGRKSAIQPTSAMLPEGGYDARLLREPAVFFAAVSDSEAGRRVHGVNSGHRCGETHFRLRGTWVDPDHRGTGVGSALARKVFDEARRQGCRFAWTLARRSSSGFYLKQGFEIVRETDEFEFGPHFYMQRAL